MDGEELRYLLKVHADISRAMKDTRFPPAVSAWDGGDLRMFVITAIWVLGVERVPRGGRIQRVCEVMRIDNGQFWRLIRSDVPRFEPPRQGWDEGGCVVELPRAKRPCGRGLRIGFRVTNPVDGTWRMANYCSRHMEEAEAAQDAERRRCEAGVPDPLPNRGGLLPCYLPWDWAKNYATADSSWSPPKVGIRADDWPVLAKVEAANPTPPKLRVVFGGQEIDGPELVDANDDGPDLHIVNPTQDRNEESHG